MGAKIPNIVLVITDDLAPGDVGAYGGGLIKTPSMDELALGGLLCEEMYAAAAWDTPSRCGILTGRYGARYSLPRSSTPGSPDGLPPRAVTIAALLRDAGYATGLFGQWRLGSQTGQRPWEHGFDRFRGSLFGVDVAPVQWYRDTVVVDADYDSADAAREITEDALAFIEEVEDAPVFAVLSHLAPHIPYRADRAFFGRSTAGEYGDVVEQLDYYLGVLLNELKPRVGERPTLVIVTSDSGPRYEGSVKPRRGRKPETFDGGVRVPFIASWLTQSTPRRDHMPRCLLDLTPSLCTLAGVVPPANLDGVDLSPLFFGQPTAPRGPVYLWFDQYLGTVRDGNWKLHIGQGGPVSTSHLPANVNMYFPMLFNYDDDVREVYSVADNHPAIVDEMRTQLLAVQAEILAEAAASQEVSEP